MILRKTLVLPLFLLAGCSGAQKTSADAKAMSPATPAAVAAKPAAKPMISRELIFGNPDRSGAQISRRKAAVWLAPHDVMNVRVAPVEDPSKGRAITQDKNRGIRSYFWSYTAARPLRRTGRRREPASRDGVKDALREDRGPDPQVSTKFPGTIPVPE
jgi:hypothetical protein